MKPQYMTERYKKKVKEVANVYTEHNKDAAEKDASQLFFE